MLEALAPLGEAFSTVFQGALELVQPIVEGLKESFQGVKDAISSAFTEEQIAAISTFSRHWERPSSQYRSLC